MKLIKAYIRTNMIDKVIPALEAGGYTDMKAATEILDVLDTSPKREFGIDHTTIQIEH